MRFNPPPNWPQPPEGWAPPSGWTPPPSWPPPPDGWPLWLPDHAAAPPSASSGNAPEVASPVVSAAPSSPPPDTARLLARIAELETRLQAGGAALPDVIELDDRKVLQDVGIYRYHH